MSITKRPREVSLFYHAWDRQSLCRAGAQSRTLAATKPLAGISIKPRPAPMAAKSIVRLTTRMKVTRVIADSSKTCLWMDKAIGWLVPRNLNCEVSNLMWFKTGRAQGRAILFWPTGAQQGRHARSARPFLHGITAPSVC
jgi:hypothetical protein